MRRPLDQYFTPQHATLELLKCIDVRYKNVLECCAGMGAISDVLKINEASVLTNDIDPIMETRHYLDAALPDTWTQFAEGCDWVISNPPFNLAPQIVPLAYEYANKGIAMLLRLSYLEPCESRVKSSRRGRWLQLHPPTRLVVLPRISFTGDGKTDNVTCAWFIWEKFAAPSGIEFVLKGSSS